MRCSTTLAALALVLTGCGDSSPRATDPSPSPPAGGICPGTLPEGEAPDDHGFGVREPATELPALAAPEQAWTCQYAAMDTGRSPDGGTAFEWRRTGPAAEVSAERLADLGSALEGLSLVPGNRPCTADLGPRWLVVFTHGGDVTGVAVDDFGCRAVRLTDDPIGTPPGDPSRDDLVTGVLGGGVGVLDAAGVGRLS